MIIPAIDLCGGEAVRLYKGDYNQKTVYGNPIDIAQKFKSMGAEYLHIVDLDGAKEGSPRNFETIKEISRILPIQVGGGIRDIKTAKEYLQFADRVIIGTAAVEKPDFLKKIIEEKGANRVVVGVDVRNGKVSTGGWLSDSGVDYLEFIEGLKKTGVQTIIVTDISRDGTLTSPNWDMYDGISGVNVIVSGGVSCEADIIKARKYKGVIVGKAYYEGKVDLEKCLKNE